MIRGLVALAVLAASALPSLAALPPHYQRQRELEAVLATAVQALGIGNPVERIEMIGADVWLVSGGRCHVTVRVVDAPTPHDRGWVGPREFTTFAEPSACD